MSVSGRQDMQELVFLQELEEDPKLSQRKLANRTGVALGLANAILGRLVRKGWIKVNTLPANRLAYILTPKGLAEKSRLLLEYVKLTTGFFTQVRDVLAGRFTALAEEQDVVSVGIVGNVELTDMVFLAMQDQGWPLGGIYDDTHVGARRLGVSVKPTEAMLQDSPDVVVIAELECVVESLAGRLPPEALVVNLSELLANRLRRFALSMKT